MDKIIDYLDNIIGDEDKEKDLKEIVSNVMSCIGKLDEDAYNMYCCKMHCLAYGPHFNEQLALEAVSKMKNADGTEGAYWSINETNSLADKLRIKQNGDWHYLLNMLHSDFSTVLGDDDDKYVDLALAYINDVDACEGRIFKEWLATR